MPTDTAAYRILSVDPREAREDDLRAVARLHQALERERLPEDPPTPLDLYVRRYRAIPSMVRLDVRVALDGADAIGLATLSHFVSETNQHVREAQVLVHPARRREGLGSRLLGDLAAGLADGLNVIGWTNDRVPAGAAFAERVGAAAGLATHLNQLETAGLDRGLVAEWAALDPAGYRAVWIEGDVPEALVPNVIAAYDAMNAAPRGDLAMDDWRTTPEMLREWDRSRGLARRERWIVLAIHDASGETAGYTEIALDPGTPHVGHQQGTAVLPAHRGRGLGKWLKALVLARLFAERPALRYIRTGNADSNAPMLAINERLGFRPAWATTIWQIRSEALRSALGR